RLGLGIERLGLLRHAPGDVLARADARQHRHVGTGTKAAAGTGEHDDAHAVVIGGTPHGVAHLVAHGAGPGVELVGTVERHGRDAVAHVIENVLVGHSMSLPGVSGWWTCRPACRW